MSANTDLTAFVGFPKMGRLSREVIITENNVGFKKTILNDDLPKSAL